DVFAVLLWGRHRLGWRGGTALRWTLGGLVVLILAYFGSKFVLELLLDRVSERHQRHLAAVTGFSPRGVDPVLRTLFRIGNGDDLAEPLPAASSGQAPAQGRAARQPLAGNARQADRCDPDRQQLRQHTGIFTGHDHRIPAVGRGWHTAG